jgi:Domain of unknown function (DUF4349)
MDPHRDDLDLATELRALRPAPQPEFTRELDARAAAGFPPSSGHPATAIHRLAERLRTTPPRRLLVPVGAFAVTAIVGVTAVVTATENGTAPTESGSRLGTAPTESGAGLNATAKGGSRNSSGVQFSGVPSAKSRGSTAGATSARAAEAAPAAVPFSAPAPGPYASRAGKREIERSAQIVLGADPAAVRADAAKVFDAVHAADGIVLRSSIRDGAAGEAGAEFDLLIPSGKLGDALADFSAIGEVRSRREATQDITAPTVGVRERLEDAEARIDGLLVQLSEATSEGERSAVEAELRAERRRAAVLRSRLASLSRRANFSHVSLGIETGAATTDEDDSGAWGVGNGLDDAGRILEIAAGVTIVGLAALTPLALLALLTWLGHRAWVRASRRRVLSQTG